MLIAAALTFSLLLPAVAAGLAVLGVEAWFRRRQPLAVAFARRTQPEARALHNLPTTHYAPLMCTVELAMLLLTIIGLVDWLPPALANGDVAGSIGIVGTMVVWLALSAAWARGLWQMWLFRHMAVAGEMQPGTS